MQSTNGAPSRLHSTLSAPPPPIAQSKNASVAVGSGGLLAGMIATVGAMPSAIVLIERTRGDAPPSVAATTSHPSDWVMPLSSGRWSVYVEPVPITSPEPIRIHRIASSGAGTDQVPVLHVAISPGPRAPPGNSTNGVVSSLGAGDSANDVRTVVVMPFAVAVTAQPIVRPACAAVVSASAALVPAATPSTDHWRRTVAPFGVQVSRSHRTTLPNRRVPVTAGCRVGVGGGVS